MRHSNLRLETRPGDGQKTSLLAGALEHIPEVFYCTDEGGRLLYVNAYGCRLLGLDKEQLLGKTVLELHPELSTRRWATATQAAREDGAIGPDEFVDNDFYIRNENPLVRLIPADQDTVVRLIDSSTGPLQSRTVTIEDFVRIIETRDEGRWLGAGSGHVPFWVMVDGESRIYQIVQQYIP